MLVAERMPPFGTRCATRQRQGRPFHMQQVGEMAWTTTPWSRHRA
jgi:hypothetical protein